MRLLQYMFIQGFCIFQITVNQGDLQQVEGLVTQINSDLTQNISQDISQEIDPTSEGIEKIEVEGDDDDLSGLDDSEEEEPSEHLGADDSEHLGTVDDDNPTLLEDSDGHPDDQDGLAHASDTLTHGSESANVSLSDAVQGVESQKQFPSERQHICGVKI